ncbi:MAG: Xaa-Pro peptidase family protein [Thermoflexales bacterium]
MNLDRCRAALAEARLDALLLLSPRHTYYATGYRHWFLNLYAEAGYAAAIVPADPAIAPLAVCTDVEEPNFRTTAPEFSDVATYRAWVAYGDIPAPGDDDPFELMARALADQPDARAGLLDPEAVTRLITERMKSAGLGRGRIGIESAFVSARAMGWLRAALPDCEFFDAGRLIKLLRAVKSPAEAGLLRLGTQLCERAITDVIASLRERMTASEIARIYRASVFNHAPDGRVLNARVTLRVGPDALLPASSGGYRLRRGDLIFLDCGVDVAGYWADMGRCAVFGQASPAQRKVYSALRAGFDAATAIAQVGAPLREVFDAGLGAVRAAGMTSYTRGNLGHGIGLHPAPELPIVSHEETLALQPGNVVSIEFPIYMNGLGALQVEDTFYFLGGGSREVFNTLSREMAETG